MRSDIINRLQRADDHCRVDSETYQGAISEITALRARLEKAEAERKEWLNKAVEQQGFYIRAVGERNRTQAQVAAVQSTLEFYAEDDRYDYDETCCWGTHLTKKRCKELFVPELGSGGVLEDAGHRAKSALSDPTQAVADHDRRVLERAALAFEKQAEKHATIAVGMDSPRRLIELSKEYDMMKAAQFVRDLADKEDGG